MCKDCAARRQQIRDAFIKRRFKELSAQAAKGAAEMIGLKEKTGAEDLEKRTDYAE